MTDTEPTPEPAAEPRPLPKLPTWKDRPPPRRLGMPRNPWVTVGIVLSVSVAAAGLIVLAIGLFISALANNLFSNK